MDTPTFQSVPRPTSSPWGGPNSSEEYGPGVWSVSTPSHGGFYLSAERNARVADDLRAAGGWYEDDCEWAHVAVTFPDLFTSDVHARALETIRHWRPNAYERITGKTLKPGESYRRDYDRFWAENANTLVACSAFNSGFAWVPEGHVGLVAREGPPGSVTFRQRERFFLVAEGEYDDTARFFVVDPSRHTEVSAPASLLGRKPSAA